MANNILIQYLIWQFFDAPKAILKAWKNFLKFNLEYFSIPLLLKTLFWHWRRYRYDYGKRLDPKRYFEALTFNLMSRAVGFVLRIFFIFFGILIEIFLIFAGLLVFLGWFALPFLLILGFGLGVWLLL